MDVETLTGRYGREIFARVQHPGALPLTPAWWDEQLMDWTMSDEAVKVQLFRFVDALPTLRSGADVTRHLREYFAEAHGHLPRWLTWGLRALPSTGILAKFLAWLARFSARRLARTFIAGTNREKPCGLSPRCAAATWPSPSICSARRPSPNRKRTNRRRNTSS